MHDKLGLGAACRKAEAEAAAAVHSLENIRHTIERLGLSRADFLEAVAYTTKKMREQAEALRGLADAMDFKAAAIFPDEPKPPSPSTPA